LSKHIGYSALDLPPSLSSLLSFDPSPSTSIFSIGIQKNPGEGAWGLTLWGQQVGVTVTALA
jgi:hypothetical protein